MSSIAYAMSAQPGAAGQSGSGMGFIVQILLIFGIFYLILIRPQQKMQQKKEREHKDMLANLKKNDQVITNGGIHGTVVNVKDKTVVLRVDDNCRIEMEKSFVAILEN